MPTPTSVALGPTCHFGFSSTVDIPSYQQLGANRLLPVTPEAAGSSPVDPANIHQQNDRARDHNEMLWSLSVQNVRTLRRERGTGRGTLFLSVSVAPQRGTQRPSST